MFDGIKFFCTSTLPDKRRVDLTLLLEHNGARAVPLEEATHVITLSLDYEGQDDAKEGSVTVTVHLSWAWSRIYVLIVDLPGLLDRPVVNPWESSAVSECA